MKQTWSLFFHFTGFQPTIAPKTSIKQYNNLISYVGSLLQNGISVQNRTSKHFRLQCDNVYTNKSLGIMVTPGRNVLPCNVMQTNMEPCSNSTWISRFEHGFGCLNTAFVYLTMTSISYAHRYLCKNIHLYTKMIRLFCIILRIF